MNATSLNGTWDLTPADRLLIEAKRWGSRLRFAVMLLFFRARGRFPRTVGEIGEDTVTEIARKLGVPTLGSAAALLPKTLDRTLERQRAEIRTLLGFREATVADADALGAWLRDGAVDQNGMVLDILVQSRRDTQAARRLMRKLLKRQCRPPRVMITDKLASYGAPSAR